MVKHRIIVEIRIGKSSAQEFSSWFPSLLTNDLEINRYGSLWGESEVLVLGWHFNLYSTGGFSKVGSSIVTTLPGTVLPSTMTIPKTKKSASSVSGNFGEVLTILALESRVGPKSLIISHLRSVASGRGAVKCPDLLLESTPLDIDYASFRLLNPTAPPLPFLIPGECKNNDFLGALRQLSKYWGEIGSGSPVYGFGLISSINYTYPALIKINIIVPKDIVKLSNLLSTKKNEELVQSDFKECLYEF